MRQRSFGGRTYYNKRYYDPTIGRFIQPDTIISSYANPQTLNRFSYVNNRPILLNDPSGHCVLVDDNPDGLCVHEDNETGEIQVVHPNHHANGGGNNIVQDLVIELVSEVSGGWNGVLNFTSRLGIQLPLELDAAYGELPFGINLRVPAGLLGGLSRGATIASVLLQMGPAQYDNFVTRGNAPWGEARYDVAADAIADAGIVAASAAAGATAFVGLTASSLGIGAVPAAVAAAAVSVTVSTSLTRNSYQSGIRGELAHALSSWSNNVALVPNPAAPAVSAPFAPSTVPAIGTPGP